jgi:hypothetical protein
MTGETDRKDAKSPLIGKNGWRRLFKNLGNTRSLLLVNEQALTKQSAYYLSTAVSQVRQTLLSEVSFPSRPWPLLVCLLARGVTPPLTLHRKSQSRFARPFSGQFDSREPAGNRLRSGLRRATSCREGMPLTRGRSTSPLLQAELLTL